MIIDVEKYLFVGIKQDLDEFFSRAQKEGVLEFIPHTAKKIYSLPKVAQDLLTAIKILEKQTVKENPQYGKEFAPQELAEKVINLKNNLEKYHEEKRLIAQEMIKISQFGEFSIEDIHTLEKEARRCVQFFFRSQGKREEALPSDELIYISSDSHVDYYIGIHSEPKAFINFVEMQFEKPLSQLKKRQEFVEEELKSHHKELQELTAYIPFLKENLTQELNAHNLHFAKSEVEMHFEDQLFVVQAWLPTMDVARIQPLLTKLAVHVEKIAIDKGEKVPTCMRNKGLRKIGEDLVKIYDIPNVKDKDPSGFIVISFAIFFSMIVADAGYGLLYLIASIFGYFKLKHKGPSVHRFMKLFVLMSSCCIAWGILIGSYFGIMISPQNPIQKASIIQHLVLKKAEYHMEMKDGVFKDWVVKAPKVIEAKSSMEFILSAKVKKGSVVSYEILEEFTNSILMELAILIGVIHIMISLCRYALRHWSHLGWLLFIIGGYLYFPSIVNDATSLFNFLGVISKSVAHQVGAQLVYIGIGLAWLGGIIQHKVKGLEEPLKALQLFADVLSYLRLYALALAGMIMASTFNQMGRDVGYVFGFFIILAGHTLNMGVGIMGGFIHGLRLNFLEWYRYSFEGEGKLFDPLKIIK